MEDIDASAGQAGANNDFAAHEQTYRFFVRGTKIGAVLVAALLAGMAAGLVGPFGFLGGLILFILLAGIGVYSLR